MDDLQALSYFSSLAHISRRVAFQEKSLIKYLGNKWTEYTPEQQEELLDDLCVPHFIRDEQPSVADDEDDDQPPCWPVLKLPSGEKIIVDENDIWTWRDEHSGPFSWKSRSQQDLTILDLEPDNLTKSYGRSHKASESDDQTPPTNTVSQKHFVPNHDSWTHAVLEDYFANCLVEVQTPAHTPSSPQSPVESPTEEINAGFEGSVEDLSPPATPAHAAVPRKPDDGGGVSRTDVQTPKSKPKIHKTPSPKKLPHPGITKKDNKEDTSQQLLIIDNRDEERHAFTNPAMEVEWSNFVGQSSTDPEDEISVDAKPQDLNKSSSASKGQRQSPLPVKEPAAMVMDRGGIGSGGEESVEGTPDHTTQLLKSSAVVVEEEEKEEVVYVVEDGAGSVSVSSKVVTTPDDLDMNSLRSGFDFLDNW